MPRIAVPGAAAKAAAVETTVSAAMEAAKAAAMEAAKIAPMEAAKTAPMETATAEEGGSRRGQRNASHGYP
jgi:hypothetical protein